VDLLDALLLGLVEGLTEYLPVSSTGHLIVTQRLLGIPASAEANAFAIAIQAGAILAVLSVYRQRAVGVARGLLGRDDAGRRLGLALAAAFAPAAVAGLLFDDWIEARLFGLAPVVAAWAAGALVMLAFDGRARRGTLGLEALTPRMAVFIGLAQCAALWPGVSRSLATLMGGVLVGLSLPAAVEFSFLLGVLTLGAATAYKSLDAGAAMWAAYGPGPLLVGAGSAWLSAWVAVRGMVAWLQRRGLRIFAAWRLVAAAAVGGAMAMGWL
jgi:undecaprenyl-diphosphatase